MKKEKNSLYLIYNIISFSKIRLLRKSATILNDVK